MIYLIAGLIVFLGAHSVRIFADGWRSRQIAQRGEMAWKGLYTLVSVAGFVLIVYGYGLSRQAPTALWTPMVWARHLASLLTLVSFVLLAAAYVPRNGIRARLHHPMILGVKLWALAHLLANHTLADLLLFGSFLVWSVLDYRAARMRDAAARTVYAPGTTGATLLTLAIGIAAWVAFALWGHTALIGMRPF